MPNADTRVDSLRDRRIATPIGERQYHIGLGPGELAEYILLPGDPDRTARDRLALRFDRARAPASGVRVGHGDLSGPARLGGVHRHRHGQRRDRGGRDPGDHGTAHLHPGRVVRRAPAGDGARATWPSRPARSASSRPRASSSTTAIRRSPTTRRSSPSSRPRSGSDTATTSGSRPRHPGSSARRAARSRSCPSATLTSPRTWRASAS